jgi:hypothetical protein
MEQSKFVVRYRLRCAVTMSLARCMGVACHEGGEPTQIK